MSFWKDIAVKMSTYHQEHIEKLISENNCPSCYGKGVITYPHYEYMYGSYLVCESCNGSGTYTN